MSILPHCPLRLHGISMAYGRRLLFSAIDAEVAPGQCLVVTGANGSGKSTLLKIIAGLVRPEAGRIDFDGVRGYAAPDVQLYGELTGDENLAFFARFRGVSGAGNAALLKQVGLPPARGRDFVSAYSSGMRQRLKLAVSLLGAPSLLIWDEPTATLDTAGRSLADEILSQSRSSGQIAIVATNDPAEAKRWGDLSLTIG
ncbi:MAG: ABC transporter ATP-binding protein [Janthinobacterium lividum]